MMRVCLHLCLSILWLNVKGSLQQHDPTCEVAVMDTRLFVAGLPPPNQPIQAGHKLHFHCSDEYKLQGSKEIECLQSGQWNSPFPVCSDPTCEVAVMDTRLFIAGLLPPNQPIQAGHKLHFHCSDEYKLQGSKEIECLQTGQWSSPFPVCFAIKCDAPASIDHGRVSDNHKEFKENEELNFVCDKGYTPRDRRPSKCTQFGGRADWSPTPECREIKCELVLPSERSTYNPPNKNMFSPGETVEVTCGETDWVSNHQTTKAVITCKDDGEWTSRPECSEFFCNDPTREQQVYNWRATREQKRLRGYVRYSCNAGFEPRGATWAQCTRDGWIPKPLCAGTTCYKHIIENADIIQNDRSSYRNGDRVMYRCLNGDQETFFLTCQQGHWNGIRTCPGITEYCEILQDDKITLEPTQTKERYADGDTLDYRCKAGTKEGAATCTNGRWSKTVECQEYCEKLQDDKITLKSTQTKERFADGDTLDYRCKAGTKEGTATCTNGRWFKTVECQGLVGCLTPPFLDNGDYLESKTEFAHNERVEYRCQQYYKMEGEPYKTCKNGNWTGEMRCLKPCTVSQDNLNDNNIDFKTPGLNKLYSEHDDHITFKCKYGFQRVGDVVMRQRCNDGEMALPTCQRRQ
ncbi:complement factor H-like isoform X3 [Melanotaenia boesemani]|uniref:complement factor H-like isoform X3 n=1 Tax=Melanotaenia boesemani TaxID=1250792 RepID=UPI001C04E513|nr:complement factor H-like isoform X3 [Melanotaenia boesemani]